MYLDKWFFIILAGLLIYVFRKVEKAFENLEDRVSDLEDKTSVLDGYNKSNIADDFIA